MPHTVPDDKDEGENPVAQVPLTSTTNKHRPNKDTPYKQTDKQTNIVQTPYKQTNKHYTRFVAVVLLEKVHKEVPCDGGEEEGERLV